MALEEMKDLDDIPYEKLCHNRAFNNFKYSNNLKSD